MPRSVRAAGPAACPGRVRPRGPPWAGAARDAAAAPWRNPWEQRGDRGRIASIAETLQESLFRPTAFFRGTAPDRGAGAALGYAVLVGTLSLAVALLWQQALGGRILIEHGGLFPPLFQSRGALAGLTLLLPVGVALGNLVWAKASSKKPTSPPPLQKLLQEIQDNMLAKAKASLTEKTTTVQSDDEFKQIIDKKGGFIKAAWCGSAECEAKVKDDTGATIRVRPFQKEKPATGCVVWDKEAPETAYWASSY